MGRVRLLALCGLLAAVLVGSGVGRSSVSSARGPLLGIAGNLPRFADLTGQESQVHQAFVGWGQGQTWGSPFLSLFATLTPIPMLHLGTDHKPPGRCEAISPAGIAGGSGDAYLIALNAAIAQWGKAIYIRPLAEMNNAINCYAGFTAGGAAKPGHSPAAYVQAFVRIYLIVHGGSAAAINAVLRAHGMPPIAHDLPANPFPRVRVVWSPLATDNPRIPGNAGMNYYPGKRFVDVDGADIFDDGTPDLAPWRQLEAYYLAAKYHWNRFSVPEWGLLPDDPIFIQHMCRWLKTHRLTELAGFYVSSPASPYDIAPKRESRDVYRGCIARLAGPLPRWATSGEAGPLEPLVTFLVLGKPRPGSSAKAPGGADELFVNFDPHTHVVGSAFWRSGDRTVGAIATLPPRSTGFVFVTKGEARATPLAPPAGATGLHVAWGSSGTLTQASWVRVGALLAQIPLAQGQTAIAMRGAA